MTFYECTLIIISTPLDALLLAFLLLHAFLAAQHTEAIIAPAADRISGLVAQ